MDSRIVPALLLAGILLTGTAVGAAVIGVDPVDAVTPGSTDTATPTPTPSPTPVTDGTATSDGEATPTPHADPGYPVPTVTAFEQTEPRCGADQQRNPTVLGNRSDGAVHVTVAANVTVSDAGTTLVRPTVRQTGGDEFVLNVTSESTGGVAAQCVAHIRYETTVALPADGDGFTLVVEHDGEVVERVESREGASGVESSAGAGD